MVQINYKLLPIKAHYFFFMAAMGPILPQLAVFGKQLGISAQVMGYIISILPIIYVLAKPGVGVLADYFSNFRKLIFMSIIIIMTICYAGFYIVPKPQTHLISATEEIELKAPDYLNECSNQQFSLKFLCSTTRKVLCNSTRTDKFEAYVTIKEDLSVLNGTHNNYNKTYAICTTKTLLLDYNETITCQVDETSSPDCFYNSMTFWLFVIFCSIGTIGFNVSNALSDAICFDVLENDDTKYGLQRVWGTVGFGVSALLAGVLVDLFEVPIDKYITPAVLVMLIFSGIDLISVTKLKLPKFSSSESIFKDVSNLLRQRKILTFLVFAMLAGIMDSFIIFFLFWHLEDVAASAGYTVRQVKLIEGCIVAAECLFGEIPMFIYSGKILKKLGFVHCLSFCFFTYAIRLGLISLITNPWYLIPIEMVMQGCTYALCYTCIVAYASNIAPPGTSATVQGLVAGVDDGVGYSIGSLIGGFSVKKFGTARSFQFFSFASILCCVAHIILRPASKHETYSSKIGNPNSGIELEYMAPSEQDTIDNKS